jgi:signal transduction histidine kinase
VSAVIVTDASSLPAANERQDANEPRDASARQGPTLSAGARSMPEPTTLAGAQPVGEMLTPIKWWPMVFSVFGLLIPNGLVLRGCVTPWEWVLAGLGTVAFVALSGLAVVSWQRHRPFLWAVWLLIPLGAAYSQLTFAGTIFFALAAHMLPWAVGGSITRSALYGSVLVAVVLSGYWFMPEYNMRYVHSALYYALTIAGQVWLVRLCTNLRRLAAVAERDRIAHDLHDLLGEALSKITLKAGLAGELLEQHGDSARARAEVAAAERICRAALGDVRQTIRAYREESRAEQGKVNVAG